MIGIGIHKKLYFDVTDKDIVPYLKRNKSYSYRGVRRGHIKLSEKSIVTYQTGGRSQQVNIVLDIRFKSLNSVSTEVTISKPVRVELVFLAILSLGALILAFYNGADMPLVVFPIIGFISFIIGFILRKEETAFAFIVERDIKKAVRRILRNRKLQK
jgi:hypothetical protein